MAPERVFDRPARRRAFTILELMVSVGIFLFIMVISVVAVSESSTILLNANGRQGAIHELAKARKWLTMDLELTNLSAGSFQHKPVPPSLGAGDDGDAIDFLSPVDPSTQQAAYAADGSSFWMRNISYYLIVPTNHDALVKQACNGIADGDGYDDSCPHKMLMRQITDQNNSNPSLPLTIQTLLTAFGPFTRPVGYQTSNALTIAAVNLLSFRVTVVNPGELSIDLRAVSLSDATREVAVGRIPLSPTTYLIEQTFSLYPKN